MRLFMSLTDSELDMVLAAMVAGILDENPEISAADAYAALALDFGRFTARAERVAWLLRGGDATPLG